MTWRQKIYGFGDSEPRTTETYTDQIMQTSHLDFFKAHNQDGWLLIIDEPDTVLVIYAREVWIYKKID